MSSAHLGIVEKAPNERLDWDVDYSRWLGHGDRIVSITTDINLLNTQVEDGTPATIDDAQFSDTAVKVTLEGGEATERYEVSVYATTLNGLVKRACFELRIKEC